MRFTRKKNDEFRVQATDPFWGVLIGEVSLGNVHRRVECAGRPCVIHTPSDHHMRTWPLVWRADKGVMERTCPHGVGHPDPDELAYLRTIGAEARSIHGCDGCCAPPETT